MPKAVGAGIFWSTMQVIQNELLADAPIRLTTLS